MCIASIILPYYKKRLFIKKTIDSILKQSFNKFEILIIYDDENKDDLSYIKKISKINLFFHSVQEACKKANELFLFSKVKKQLSSNFIFQK